MTFRQFLLLLVLTFAVLCSSGCSIFRMSDYNSFGEWYVGPVGMNKMLDGARASEGLDCKRPFIYGHFRTPEILFQPAGWCKYPNRCTVTNQSMFAAMAAQQRANDTGMAQTYMRTTVYSRGPDNSLAFDWIDAGMIEVLPYRTWFSDKGAGYKVGMTVLHPLNYVWMGLVKACFVLPTNLVHNGLKACAITFAAIYYAASG